MSGKNKGGEMMAKLSAMNRAAVADVPPVLAPAPASSTAAPPAVAARPAAARPDKGGGRRNTAVNLTGGAVEALRQLQAALQSDSGPLSVTASVAMCVALRYAAGSLPENRRRLAELFVEVQQGDKRRRSGS